LGYGGVLKRGVSQNRWFTMENPSKMDENGWWTGVPPY
jgi:hypothetical protein